MCPEPGLRPPLQARQGSRGRPRGEEGGAHRASGPRSPAKGPLVLGHTRPRPHAHAHHAHTAGPGLTSICRMASPRSWTASTSSSVISGSGACSWPCHMPSRPLKIFPSSGSSAKGAPGLCWQQRWASQPCMAQATASPQARGGSSLSGLSLGCGNPALLGGERPHGLRPAALTGPVAVPGQLRGTLGRPQSRHNEDSGRPQLSVKPNRCPFTHKQERRLLTGGHVPPALEVAVGPRRVEQPDRQGLRTPRRGLPPGGGAHTTPGTACRPANPLAETRPRGREATGALCGFIIYSHLSFQIWGFNKMATFPYN